MLLCIWSCIATCSLKSVLRHPTCILTETLSDVAREVPCCPQTCETWILRQSWEETLTVVFTMAIDNRSNFAIDHENVRLLAIIVKYRAGSSTEDGLSKIITEASAPSSHPAFQVFVTTRYIVHEVNGCVLQRESSNSIAPPWTLTAKLSLHFKLSSPAPTW